MHMIILFLLVLYITPTKGQVAHDVIIHEIMADPSPSIRLPNLEWIEIINISNHPVSLRGWRLGEKDDLSGGWPDSVIAPGAIYIICSNTGAATLRSFGQVIGVTSFPSLDNEAGEVFLLNANGKTVHAVGYSKQWYNNPSKQEGGWTLEMIDSHQPCAGSSNWKASTDDAGGTPGRPNAVKGSLPGIFIPQLKKAFTINDSTIKLVFDGTVDSIAGSNHELYTANNNLAIRKAIALPPLFTSVELHAQHPIDSNVIFTLQVSTIQGCHIDATDHNKSTRIAVPRYPAKGDWIINEILFDPMPNGYDYIELLNNSNKVLDAASMQLANRSATGQPSSIVPLSTEPAYVYPGDYLVLTPDPSSLVMLYHVKDASTVMTLNNLPSFPDAEGNVLLLNQHGEIMDDVAYKDDWHFGLVTYPEGVSLERISPDLPSNQRDNWTSAASTAGSGTPGYKNSQQLSSSLANGQISIDPPVFSPDNDGWQDLSRISISNLQPGTVCSIQIYDATGQQVRTLAGNVLADTNFTCFWDGLDKARKKLSMGPYIVLLNCFQLNGAQFTRKRVVTIACRKK